jgi:uncharacterized protein involved in exopolysaccharide biosynthesis
MAGAIVAGIVSLVLAPSYQAQSFLRPSQGMAGNAGLPQGALSIAATLSPGLLGKSAEVEANVARMRSDEFLRKFVTEAGVLEALLDEGLIGKSERKLNDRQSLLAAESVIAEAGDRVRRKMLHIEVSPSANVVSVSLRWRDPKVASEWVNEFVNRFNVDAAIRLAERSRGHMRFLEQELEQTADVEARKTIYSLMATQLQNLMIANVQQTAAFDVIAESVPPSRPTFPKPAFLVVLGGVVGFLVWAMARSACRALMLVTQ